MNDFNEKFDVYLNAATTMRDQVIQARELYCKKLRKHGLIRVAHS